jgi:polynucleotide 5'-triphosphatase
MTKKQNQTLNKLLNDVTSESHSPNSPNTHPIQFFRARHIDSFYNIASSQRGGGKVRVSRDREGNIVPDGVIRKRRIGDLNVYSPRSAFDWRISINTEEPSEETWRHAMGT